jgi:hypothetical protein
MKRSGFFRLAVFLTILFSPAIISAGYLYPGSAGYQPLAVIEPATPDGLFHSWTGEIERAGRTNLGAKLDSLRNADNSKDWDEIFSITGSIRRGERLMYGVTIPYIVRDPEFNESDLLDIRAFARMRLMGNAPGSGISGELSAILPTAKDNDIYPFTLDSPVIGARLAFSGSTGKTRLGLNVGYQNYLNTETGDDSDLIYSTWLEKDLDGPWVFVAEVYGSQHSHSGEPGDDEVSDNYFLAGIRRIHSEKTNFGISASSGLGGDSAADLCITVLATVKLGTVEKKAVERKKVEKIKKVEEKKVEPVKEIEPERKEVEEKKKEVAPEKVTPAPAPGAIVVVMIAEGITSGETEKRITKALQKEGFATGTDPNPGIRSTGRNVLYYMPGMQERALSVSKALIAGGHLKDLRIEESKVRLPGGWLLLMPGGEK